MSDFDSGLLFFCTVVCFVLHFQHILIAVWLLTEQRNAPLTIKMSTLAITQTDLRSKVVRLKVSPESFKKQRLRHVHSLDAMSTQCNMFTMFALSKYIPTSTQLLNFGCFLERKRPNFKGGIKISVHRDSKRFAPQRPAPFG